MILSSTHKVCKERVGLGWRVILLHFYQHTIQDIYLTYYSALRDVGRNSSVAIVTRYGLDGPGIESRWGLDFP